MALDDATLKIDADVRAAIAELLNLRNVFLQTGKQYLDTGNQIKSAFASFTGDKLIGEAHAYMKAVEAVGGAARLTTQEKIKLNQVLTEAIEKYRALGQSAPKAMMDMQRSVADATGQSSKFFDTLFFKITGGVTAGTILANGLLKAFDLIGTGISKLIEGFSYLIERGSKVSQIREGFENLSAGIGQYAGEVLDRAREKSKGLITDFDMMQAANRAMLFGLNMTPEAFGKLTDAGVRLGRAMGLDARKSLDDLVLALGRVSPRILDNLGIIVKVGEANEKWAKENDKSVKAMTAQERVTAFTNLALERMEQHLSSMGEIHLNLADKILIARNRFTNFVDALSLGINESKVIHTLFDALGKVMGDAFGANQQNNIKTIVGWIEQFAIWIVRATEYGIDFAISVKREWSAIAALGAGITVQVMRVVEGFVEAHAQFSNLAATLNPFSQATQDSNVKVQAFLKTVKDLRAEQEKIAEDANKSAKGQDSWTASLITARAAVTTLRTSMEAAQGQTEKWVVQAVRHKTALDEETTGTSQLGEQNEKLADKLSKLNSLLVTLEPTQKNIALVTKEYGSQIEDLTNKAQLSGVVIPQAVNKWSTALKNREAQKALDELIEKMGVVQGLPKHIVDELEKQEEKRVRVQEASLERSKDAIRLYENKYYEETRVGVAKRLAEIERERQERLDKLGPKPEEWTPVFDQWRLATEKINAYYAAVADNVEKENKQIIDNMKRTWTKDMGEVLSKVPGIIQAALTGGGGWQGVEDGLLSMFGEVFVGPRVSEGLTSLINKFSTNLSNIFGANTVAAFGQMAPALSSALAAAIGPALNKLESSTNDALSALGTAGKWASAGSIAGPYGAAVGAIAGFTVGLIRSMNEGKKAVQAFAKSFGGFDDLHERLATLGDLGEKLWQKLRGVPNGSPEQAKRVIDMINAAFAKQQEVLKEVTGLYNGYFETLLTKATGMGKTLPESIIPYINKLREMGMITQDIATKFLDMTKSNEMGWETMQSLADKYGISIDSLGPRFQQQKLTATATEIINAFESLVNNGADFNGVLAGMTDEINEVVRNSLKFGTEIPGNMKPWIEALIASGQLLDENGDKITDINSLKFGENVKSDLDDVVDKLQELIDILTNKFGVAFQEVAKQIDAHESVWERWARRAKENAKAVYDEINAISFGHSPGGLKEIPIKLDEARFRIGEFARSAVGDFGRVSRAVDDMSIVTGEDLSMGVNRLDNPAALAGTGIIQNHIHVYAMDGHEIDNFVEQSGQNHLNERRWKIPNDVVLMPGQRGF